MSLLQIVNYPGASLRQKSTAIDKITPEITKLAEDMLETMYQNDGVGLAANQINVTQRILVTDCSDRRNQPLVLINPEIVKTEGEIVWNEGCLSFPQIYLKIRRAETIVVQFLDQHGKQQEIKANKLLGVCIQHEMDHINGKVFIDYFSPLKQQLLRKKLEKNIKKLSR